MIYVIDFGSQLAHLISRRLRQVGVDSTLVRPEVALTTIKKNPPTGIILSGGPSSVYEPGAPTVSKKIFSLNIPVFGICYGWQLMAHLLHGEVKSGRKEYGPEALTIFPEERKTDLRWPTGTMRVIMSHGDSVMKAPQGFHLVGSTPSVPYAVVADDMRRLYGVQFHPEAEHTEHGLEMLRRFAIDVCGEQVKEYVHDPEVMIQEIRDTVGKAKVLCAVSGGVDSTVAAALIAKAIGKQLIPVYVESGFMRLGTVEHVRHIFTKLIPAHLVVVEARDRFLAALRGQDDPEMKRKIIGQLYVDIFHEVAVQHRDVQFLGQGTIYSDVIESQGSQHAAKIKSHHNVGGLPEKLGFRLLEPLRGFYKDEVRELGRKLGLPEVTVQQQPMPGPGYAIRIRGEVTPERLEQEIQADAIVMEEVQRAGLYERVFQCFAVMTGAMSTAVKGDGRAFAEVVAVRAYESSDIMTTQWAHLPYDVLQRISSRIVNEVPNVSRVVYDITTKPPATMEWE